MLNWLAVWSHAEAGAPIDVDDRLVRGGNLRANSHRQAEAYGLHWQEPPRVNNVVQG